MGLASIIRAGDTCSWINLVPLHDVCHTTVVRNCAGEASGRQRHRTRALLHRGRGHFTETAQNHKKFKRTSMRTTSKKIELHRLDLFSYEQNRGKDRRHIVKPSLTLMRPTEY
jgi:hypothetical protein